MDSTIRKTEDNLITIGNGVILFGVWSFVKYMLNIFIIDTDILAGQPKEIKLLLITVFLGISLTGAGSRVYVGLAARLEGTRRKRLPYLLLTGFMLLLYGVVVAAELILFFISLENIVYSVIVMVIDVTSMLFLLQLMINSLRIRRLRKQTTVSGGHHER